MTLRSIDQARLWRHVSFIDSAPRRTLDRMRNHQGREARSARTSERDSDLVRSPDDVVELALNVSG